MLIRELNLDTISDWFDFFDNRAFIDHEEWNGCYCTAFYYPKPKEYVNQSDRKKDGADVDKFVIFDTISSKSSTDLLVSRS